MQYCPARSIKQLVRYGICRTTRQSGYHVEALYAFESTHKRFNWALVRMMWEWGNSAYN